MPGLGPLSGCFRATLAATAVALICAGCALSIPYTSIGPHNLHIRTTTGARTPFAATNAWLEIQRVMPGCRGEVEGEIFLRGPADSIHLPAGRMSNLVFKFRTSSLFGQTAGTTSYATLIRPREGYTYEAAVTYSDGLFTIDIVEIAPQRASSRKLPRLDIISCQLA
jgi:hypothetical protein